MGTFLMHLAVQLATKTVRSDIELQVTKQCVW